MKKLLLLSLILLTGFGASAQVSRYLEKGQSGIGLSIGAPMTYGVQGISGHVGGGIKGIIDIEFSYTKEAYNNKRLDYLLDEKVSSDLYEVWVNWWVLRKEITPSILVDVAIWGEFAYSGYKNYRYMDPDTTTFTSYHEGELGFDCSFTFKVTDTWWIVPGYYGYFALGQDRWDDHTGHVKDNYTGFGSSLFVGIAKRIKKSSVILQFNQNFYTSESSTNAYQVSLGYVFGL